MALVDNIEKEEELDAQHLEISESKPKLTESELNGIYTYLTMGLGGNSFDEWFGLNETSGKVARAAGIADVSEVKRAIDFIVDKDPHFQKRPAQFGSGEIVEIRQLAKPKKVWIPGIEKSEPKGDRLN